MNFSAHFYLGRKELRGPLVRDVRRLYFFRYLVLGIVADSTESQKCME